MAIQAYLLKAGDLFRRVNTGAKLNQGLQRTAFPARCTSKSAAEPRR